MSRPYQTTRLAARRKYKGAHYIDGKLRLCEFTGHEWRGLTSGMRAMTVDDDAKCVHAYVGSRLVYEIYL
jgi:hypothetical protein